MVYNEQTKRFTNFFPAFLSHNLFDIDGNDM